MVRLSWFCPFAALCVLTTGILVGGAAAQGLNDGFRTLKQSTWDTTYQTSAGEVRAQMRFNDRSGSYDVLDAAGNVMGTGTLSNVNYMLSTTPGQEAFGINGNWSYQGQAGYFEFRSEGGINRFTGAWGTGQGPYDPNRRKGGNWTGSRRE